MNQLFSRLLVLAVVSAGILSAQLPAVTTYPAGNDPWGIAFDGANIWVANSTGGTVTKLRASDGMNLGVFNVGADPFDIVFDGTNIWVVTSAGLVKVRPSDGTILDNIDSIGRSPVVFDGTYLWATSCFQGGLIPNERIGRVGVSDDRQYPGFNPLPDGGCYFNLLGFDGMYVWGTGRIFRPFDAGGVGGLSLNGEATFDGTNFWVASSMVPLSGPVTYSLTKIRSSDRSIIATYSLAGEPSSVAFDGMNLWVADNTHSTVSELRTSDGAVLLTLPIPSAGPMLFDGTSIWITNTNSNTVARVGSVSSISLVPFSPRIGPNGGPLNVSVTAPPSTNWTATSNASWITIAAGTSGTGNGTVNLSVAPLNSVQPRAGTLMIAGLTYIVYQAAAEATFSVDPTSATIDATATTGTINVTASAQDLPINISSSANWLTAPSVTMGSGPVTYGVTPNTSAQPRTGTLAFSILDGHQGLANVSITQPGAPASFAFNPQWTYVGSAATTGSTMVLATPGDASWTAISNAPWITITSGGSSDVAPPLKFSIAANTSAGLRTGTITVGSQTFTVYQAPANQGAGLGFYPVTPCRVVDTRQGPASTFGAPSFTAGTIRSFPVPTSSCGIPNVVGSYSLNITVVPKEPLAYLSVWPTGQPQPLVSTLNSYDGRIVANAAIVSAGTNGSISVFASNATDVIIDINGYFAPPATQALAFYPLTPCRVMDTRPSGGKTGDFGPPSLAAGATRTISVPGGSCNIPAAAQAFVLNTTVVPPGQLFYLSTWPAGQTQPRVSTLNDLSGDVIANATIVPAGSNGGISFYATDATDLVVDISGYFAPPGNPGALLFYPAAPCRVVDTRATGGKSAPFGPPSMAAGSRDFPLPAGSCGLPTASQAYSLNVTVVPPGPFGYLTAWPTGQALPYVSTLNSWLGKVMANAAIVPAGTSGSISVFVTNPTDVILDVNGYFAP